MISIAQVSSNKKKTTTTIANDVFVVGIDCYRKKQRGDCGGLDFQRAANERAQYVHNRRHPDQPSPKPNPRPPIQQDLSRQTSWTLRQLERRFLSHQEPTTKEFQVFKNKKSSNELISSYQILEI